MRVIRQTRNHHLHYIVSREGFFSVLLFIFKSVTEVKRVDEPQRKLLHLLSLRSGFEKLQRCYKHLLSKLKNKNDFEIQDKLVYNTNKIFALVCRCENNRKLCGIARFFLKFQMTCGHAFSLIKSFTVCRFRFVSPPFSFPSPWSFV